MHSPNRTQVFSAAFSGLPTSDAVQTSKSRHELGTAYGSDKDAHMKTDSYTLCNT